MQGEGKAVVGTLVFNPAKAGNIPTTGPLGQWMARPHVPIKVPSPAGARLLRMSSAQCLYHEYDHEKDQYNDDRLLAGESEPLQQSH